MEPAAHSGRPIDLVMTIQRELLERLPTASPEDRVLIDGIAIVAGELSVADFVPSEDWTEALFLSHTRMTETIARSVEALGIAALRGTLAEAEAVKACTREEALFRRRPVLGHA